jgi:hypothetical protein
MVSAIDLSPSRLVSQYPTDPARELPAVSGKDYTLNFLWVNLNPQDRDLNEAQHIFGKGLDASMSSTDDLTRSIFTHNLKNWAINNPEAQINLWTDTALLTQKAIEHALTMIREISASTGADLRLRDIRQLPNLQGELRHTMHPGTPVFFRVDLLKVLILDYMCDSKVSSPKYCVVSDIDVKPMSAEQLFYKHAFSCLNHSEAGYIFNRQRSDPLENSFFIFNKEMKSGVELHRKFLIESLESKLRGSRVHPLGTDPKNFFGSESVFRGYDAFREEETKRIDTLCFPPRTVVQCPPSQFYYKIPNGPNPRTEIFRFVEGSDLPYTRYGRNYSADEVAAQEKPIEGLRDWVEKPLEMGGIEGLK